MINAKPAKSKMFSLLKKICGSLDGTVFSENIRKKLLIPFKVPYLGDSAGIGAKAGGGAYLQ